MSATSTTNQQRPPRWREVFRGRRGRLAAGLLLLEALSAAALSGADFFDPTWLDLFSQAVRAVTGRDGPADFLDARAELDGPGDAGDRTVERIDPASVAKRTDGTKLETEAQIGSEGSVGRVLAYETRTEAAQLSRELAFLSRDAVYEAAVSRAADLVETIRHSSTTP